MILQFRVWNDRYQEFSNWGFFDGHFKGIPTGGGLDIETCRDKSEAATGLLDDDGVMIYYGDILECYLPANNEIGVACIDCTVKWDDQRCRGYLEYESISPRGTFQTKLSGRFKKKIIGHIHQKSNG
jgi:hypothetical protein